MAGLFYEAAELPKQWFPQCVLLYIDTVVGNQSVAPHYLFPKLKVVRELAANADYLFYVENLLDFGLSLERLEEIRLLLLVTLVLQTWLKIKRFLTLESAISQSRNIERTVAAWKREYECRSFLLGASHSKFVSKWS